MNALLNIAESLAACASAINGLLYALKYSKDNGMSVSESIEVGTKAIAEGLSSLSAALESRSD